VSSLGEILRSARQKRNLTLTEAADQTRIKSHFLEALENGDYNVLPGPAYVTGFLRNYARFLGLHPDDVVQEYYVARPAPVPTVKPATRVLASGFDRAHRKRLLWALTVVAAMLVAGYAIKTYSDNANRASANTLSVTPANLQAPNQQPGSHDQRPAVKTVRLALRAVQPTFVRVTVDGKRLFDGPMQSHPRFKSWIGHRSIVVATFDGSHVQVRVNGKGIGFLSTNPGMAVGEATPSGWRPIS
jgi:cytoskeletal protein RodZ